MNQVPCIRYLPLVSGCFITGFLANSTGACIAVLGILCDVPQYEPGVLEWVELLIDAVTETLPPVLTRTNQSAVPEAVAFFRCRVRPIANDNASPLPCLIHDAFEFSLCHSVSESG